MFKLLVYGLTRSLRKFAPIVDLLGLNDYLASLLLGPSQQCIEDHPEIVPNPPNTTTNQPSPSPKSTIHPETNFFQPKKYDSKRNKLKQP
jgi:hypothetical protein